MRCGLWVRWAVGRRVVCMHLLLLLQMLVELRAFVRKGGQLKYELEGVRWKSSFAPGGTGPPTGIFSL